MARLLSFSIISIVVRLDVYRGVAISGRESGLLQTASAPVTTPYSASLEVAIALPDETPL